MTKEQELKAQVEKIKESIAKAFREVDEITFSDFGADSILRWEELADETKGIYYRYATFLLSTVLADLKVDTRETPKFPCEDCWAYQQPNHGAAFCSKDERCAKFAEWQGAKAARAKFVAVGEIVKEMEK